MQHPTQYAACPNCGGSNAITVGYTWWGGVIGPAMFTHVKCLNCGKQYNGKSGKSNQQNIILYFVGSFVILVLLIWGFGIITSL
jgi:hypothetical protein